MFNSGLLQSDPYLQKKKESLIGFFSSWLKALCSVNDQPELWMQAVVFKRPHRAGWLDRRTPPQSPWDEGGEWPRRRMKGCGRNGCTDVGKGSAAAWHWDEGQANEKWIVPVPGGALGLPQISHSNRAQQPSTHYTLHNTMLQGKSRLSPFETWMTIRIEYAAVPEVVLVPRHCSIRNNVITHRAHGSNYSRCLECFLGVTTSCDYMETKCNKYSKERKKNGTLLKKKKISYYFFLSQPWLYQFSLSNSLLFSKISIFLNIVFLLAMMRDFPPDAAVNALFFLHFPPSSTHHDPQQTCSVTWVLQ